MSTESEILCEADPCVLLLNSEVESGALSRDHIFYKYIYDALRFAKRETNFQRDKSVRSFFKTIKRVGGSRTANCLRGPGFMGQKFGGTYDFEWEDWNFPSPTVQDDAGYSVQSGIFNPFLRTFIARCCESSKDKIKPIIDNKLIKLFPVSSGRDGMAIKPGFAFDRRQKIIVEGKEIIDLEHVDKFQTSDLTRYRDFFNTEAETCSLQHVTIACVQALVLTI